MSTKEITETIRGLNRSKVKNKEELIESFCCDILEEQSKDTETLSCDCPKSENCKWEQKDGRCCQK